MTGLTFHLDGDELDALAEMVAERVARRIEAFRPPASPWMTLADAAEYLRCKPQRIHDLLSQRRLTRHKDGGRTLISRVELERYVEECR